MRCQEMGEMENENAALNSYPVFIEILKHLTNS